MINFLSNKAVSYIVCMLLVGVTSGCVNFKQMLYSYSHLTDGTVVDQKFININDSKLVVRSTNFMRVYSKENKELNAQYYTMMTNEGYRPIRNMDSFFVEVVIIPEKNGISINPDGFILHIDGQAHDAIVYGPAPLRDGWRSYVSSRLCDFRIKDPHETREGYYLWDHPDAYKPSFSLWVRSSIILEKGREYCFALKFPTPAPDPENKEFFLELGGVNLTNDNRNPLKIYFKPKKITEAHN